MRTLTITVREEWAGRKVKSILKRELHMADILISRVKLRPSGITLNGKRVFTDAPVGAGDVLAVEVGDENGQNEAEPVCAPLDMIYEDEDIAVINKTPDMAVHGSTGGNGCTVANALAYRWGAGQAFHPVNRLDRGTSGLMVIAKSAYVHDLLRRQLHTDYFGREYLALTGGKIVPTEGSITLPVIKDPQSPTKRTVSPMGQEARTDYCVERYGEDFTLVRLRLFTGRTHQIRVHLAAIGHPLLGDSLYGNGETEEFTHPALHSEYLRLRHPVSGEILELHAPLPDDMQRFLTEHK